jgi:hypothetical protein
MTNGGERAVNRFGARIVYINQADAPLLCAAGRDNF